MFSTIVNHIQEPVIIRVFLVNVGDINVLVDASTDWFTNKNTAWSGSNSMRLRITSLFAPLYYRHTSAKKVVRLCIVLLTRHQFRLLLTDAAVTDAVQDSAITDLKGIITDKIREVKGGIKRDKQSWFDAVGALDIHLHIKKFIQEFDTAEIYATEDIDITNYTMASC